jgi:hypothetical protein
MTKKKLFQLLDEVDTALMTLHIGQDHGITPQAASACREVWAKVIEGKQRLNRAYNGEKYAADIRNVGFRDCKCD